jgi:hypothetical protein
VVARDPIRPWNRADAILALAASGCSLLLGAALFVRRPDLVAGAEFLFHDAGHNLLTAHAILSGQTLYRDIFFPYGPISAYAYAVAAWRFGNTPEVYLGLFAVVSAMNAAFAYRLVRRSAGAVVAVAVSVGLLALLPIPGAIAGAFISSPYIVLERTLLLLLALTWSPPDARSTSRAVGLGLVFGLWQGIKFGGAFVGGVAIVILDALCLTAVGWSNEGLRRWARSLLVTGAAFLGVESLWIVHAFATQPAAVAHDMIWPYFMFHAYAVVGDDVRWLTWGGWRLMVGRYLLPLTAAMLGIYGLGAWLRTLRKGREADASGSAFILLLFYAIASCGYFHHVFHFQQFFWALVPPAAFAIERASTRTRLAVAAAWAPCVWLVLHTAVLTHAPASMETVRLPTGGRVVVSAAIAERLSFLARIHAATGGAPILYAPVGSGWHYAYGVPAASRHTFFFAPDVIRPYERDAFVRSIDRLGALVTCDDVTGPASLDGQLLLDETMRTLVFGRLQLWQRGAGCIAYRVSPADELTGPSPDGVQP